MYLNTFRFAAATIAVLLLTGAADARTRHHHYRHLGHTDRTATPVTSSNCDNDGRCTSAIVSYETTLPTAPRGYYYDGRMVGGRHPGDPSAFCGAEAARYVFGEVRRDLWPAIAWIKKYPRTQPAPGMAAARNHHVMILMSQVSGSNWMVHDGNSGGHRTWEHVRSIAGYVIVNPHGSRYAMR